MLYFTILVIYCVNKSNLPKLRFNIFMFQIFNAKLFLKMYLYFKSLKRAEVPLNK